MTEKRPTEETICPWLAMAAIIKWGTLYDSRDSGGVSTYSLKEEVKCMGEECQMFALHFKGCGMRQR